MPNTSRVVEGNGGFEPPTVLAKCGPIGILSVYTVDFNGLNDVL